MTAIECVCGLKVKTAQEPATPHEMSALFERMADHGAANMAAAGNALAQFARGENVTEKSHRIRITYHEITPATGFEEAVVVESNT